jgi:uncharacterized repeat protein (TIGR03803 family)
VESLVPAVGKTGARASAARLAAAFFLAASGPPAAHAVTLTTLYDFCAQPSCVDGQEPSSAPVADAAGNLYGTVSAGGANGVGGVFTLIRNKAAAWTEKIIYNFSLLRGEGGPAGSLLMPSPGKIYGATGPVDGTHRSGTIFELKLEKRTGQWMAKTLYKFCSRPCLDGQRPNGSLVMAPGGTLYGTTLFGGVKDSGTVFALIPNAAGTKWTHLVLYRFCAHRVKQICADGAGPSSGVVLDKAGELYGVALNGGAKNGGVVYQLVPQSSTPWGEAVRHSFCEEPGCPDGFAPVGGLVFDANQERLFGTTTQGGEPSGQQPGLVYVLTRGATGVPWPYQVLYNFCSQGGCADGFNPYSTLAIDKSGNLYGTTRLGGTGTAGNGGMGGGTAFVLSPAARPPWLETVLYSFCQEGGFACSDGSVPVAGLTPAGKAGSIYGATEAGGAHGGGTVFEISP